MAGKAQNFTQRQHMLRPGYEIFRYCDSELGEVSLHHHDFYEIYLFPVSYTHLTLPTKLEV